MTFLYFLTITLFLMIAILLCLVILMQESKSTGLGASFGGDASDSVFGTSTADVLKTFTSYLAVGFLVLCILLSIWTQALGRSKDASLDPLYSETIEQ
jgi:preprotein translocase subunit SecG